jgi:putative transcriptional regulator
MASAYESIAQGLQEAIELNQGHKVAARTYRPEPVNVAEIRKNLGMTQM